MLVIDQRDDIGDANPEPGRSILNFHVDDFAYLQIIQFVQPPHDPARVLTPAGSSL